MAAPDSGWRLIENAADIDTAKAAGEVGLIMGWQNSRPIGDVLDRLEARLSELERLELEIFAQPTPGHGAGNGQSHPPAVVEEVTRLLGLELLLIVHVRVDMERWPRRRHAAAAHQQQ